MIGWLKRTSVIVLAGFGLLIAALLALGILANFGAALWVERWQFIVVGPGLGALLLAGLLRRK